MEMQYVLNVLHEQMLYNLVFILIMQWNNNKWILFFFWIKTENMAHFDLMAKIPSLEFIFIWCRDVDYK